MQEMMEASEFIDMRSNWEYLLELLTCYLALNHKSTHKFIIGAFADLVVCLMTSPPVNSGGRTSYGKWIWICKIYSEVSIHMWIWGVGDIHSLFGPIFSSIFAHLFLVLLLTTQLFKNLYSWGWEFLLIKIVIKFIIFTKLLWITEFHWLKYFLVLNK